MMQFYVACHSRELAHKVAEKLKVKGFSIVSRWHEKPFNPTEMHTLAQRHAIAIEDFNDIKRADALVLVAGPEKYSGGKFVEAGIAYGLGKPVYVEGCFENMLTYLFEPLPEEWLPDRSGRVSDRGRRGCRPDDVEGAQVSPGGG